MNILPSIYRESVHFFEQSVLPPLSDRQKRVAVVCLAALSLLAACFAICYYCYKAKKVGSPKGDDIKERDPRANTQISDQPKVNHPQGNQAASSEVSEAEAPKSGKLVISLVSETRIQALVEKYSNKIVYANTGKLNYFSYLEKGGLAMYYDGGYPGKGRWENGQICLIRSSEKVYTFDYPTVAIDIEDLTKEEKQYFIDRLSLVDRRIASAKKQGLPLTPKEEIESSLLARLRASL